MYPASYICILHFVSTIKYQVQNNKESKDMQRVGRGPKNKSPTINGEAFVRKGRFQFPWEANPEQKKVA